MTKQQLTLANAEDGLPIGLHVYGPTEPDDSNLPLLMVYHGMKGFANWGHFPSVCQTLADDGLRVVCFDFSRNGVENFGDDITRSDLTEDNSIRRETAEAMQVVAAIADGSLKIAADTQRIALLGHSFGSMVAIHHAAAAQESGAIQAVITWSAPASFDHWPQEIYEDWKKTGRRNAPNARTGADFFLGRPFLNEAIGPDKLDPLARAAQATQPLLLIHGNQDPVVPYQQSEALLAASAATDKQLEIIEDADHTFGIKHPYAGPTPQQEKLVTLTRDWLRRFVLN